MDESNSPKIKMTVRFNTTWSVADSLESDGVLSGVTELEFVEFKGGSQINRYEAVLNYWNGIIHLMSDRPTFEWEVVNCHHVRTDVIQVKQRRWDKMCVDCHVTVKEKVDPPGRYSGKIRVIRMDKCKPTR
jgi:hypothetical protein